jgi:polyribonucleotide nucleotidyltransferase
MDFKVAGSKNGITAIQMDIKIAELDFDILKNALIQAKEGRLHILEKMNEVINAPRAELSPYAPRLLTMQINPDKIRDIIGPSGKTIKNIIDETGAKIDIDQSGSIKIFADSKESLEKTEEIISTIVKDLQEGDIVVAKVIKILDFGAILELKPGSTGLLHISEIENRRINKVTDVLNLGDEVKVKIIKIERDGKIKVSKKSAE